MGAAAPVLTTCPACGTTLDANGDCLRCKAAFDGAEQAEAIDFVLRRLEDWHHAGRLTDRQWQALSAAYTQERDAIAAAGQAGRGVVRSINMPSHERCWSCKEQIAGNPSHCHACGAPASAPAVKSLRFYRFLSRELDSLERGGTITLRQAHELVAETQDRIAALKNKLERDRAPLQLSHPASDERLASEPDGPIPYATVRAGQPSAPRRTFMEVLLDPRTIQWLLASGGGLLVLGLIIWLTALGVFENPRLVAIGLGVGNGVLLLGGWAVTLRTRHQIAGRALTLLACLVMPLNLWFYQYHGLVTLEGHLWVAALVCSIIYALSALVLKDRLFVYVLVGGITLTGLLFLGVLQLHDQIFGPVTMLVVLSLICLHAERAFPPSDDSPFSRQRFGMAFYWCAQGLLVSGLLILLVAQLIGWLHEPVLRHLDMIKPAVATREYLPWTLMLVLAGTYALVYADVVVRRIGVYIYIAAVTLLWAEIQMLVLLNTGSEAVVIITLACTALLINVAQAQFAEKRDFLRTVPPLGVLLSIVPVLFGVLLHFRATNRILHDNWAFEIDWLHVGAMLLTALSCRVGAYLYRKTWPELSVFYFFATAAATLVFAAGLAWMIGMKAWEIQAPVLMVIPILYLIAAHLYRGHSPENPLVWCAHAATALMLVCSFYVAAGIVPQVDAVTPVTGRNLNLLFAVFGLECTLFYSLAAGLRKEGWNIYLATVMLCGATWQLLSYFSTPAELYPLAFALVGLGLLIAYRFALLDRLEWAGLSRAGFQCANALTTLGFAAGIFLALSRLIMDQHSLDQLDAGHDWRGPVRLAFYLMLFLGVVSLVAAWIVQQQAWRRTYLVLAIVNAVMTGFVYHKLHPLNPWQTLEVVSVVAGAALVILGHVGWYRESDERSSEAVSLALFFGAAAILLPLAIATGVWRFYVGEISALNELALVFGCVALFGSGVMCRLKATTLFGAITLVAYVLMVVIYLHRFLREMEIIGIYLTMGGVLLFGAGLALSVWRDRLLALPDRIKRREGLFRVFGWR